MGVAKVVALASWGYSTNVWPGVNLYAPGGPSAGAGLKAAHCCVLSFTLRQVTLGQWIRRCILLITGHACMHAQQAASIPRPVTGACANYWQ